MKAFFTPLRIILFSVIVFAGGLLLVANFTEVCTLQAVTLNNDQVIDWNREFALASGAPVFMQPVDSLAQAMIATSAVHRIDVDYQFPHAIAIRVNDYTPICLFLDAPTGSVHGVTDIGMVIPLEKSQIDWKMPMINGAEFRGLYKTSGDTRVAEITRELMRNGGKHPELISQLSDIDFSDPDAVTLYFNGSNFKVLISADQFASHWNNLSMFLTQYKVARDSMLAIDVRHGDLIVTQTIPIDSSKIEKPEPVNPVYEGAFD